MSVERKEFGDRGLGQYGDTVKDTYGATEVTVSDSSAAMYDACWLRLEGSAHVAEGVEIEEYSPAAMFQGKRIPATRIVDGFISAHLDLPRAKQIVEELQGWINMHDDGDENNSKEGSGW